MENLLQNSDYMYILKEAPNIYMSKRLVHVRLL